MQIAVIHNFDSATRFDMLMQEFKIQGIRDFKFFPAVHDSHSVKKAINLAHKQCVRYALDNNLPEICIMEDDVRFTNKNSFSYFLEHKPEDFDVYLSGIYLGEILKDNSVKEFSGFHCYIVNKKFYETYLSLPDDAHIDRALAGLGKYYVSVPFIAIQHNGFSYNTKMEMNYDDLLIGRELY
jgi:GR25 family glycosyltransferase involved in LPS biosynthesis